MATLLAEFPLPSKEEMRMKLVVAVDEAWGIGKNGDLLRRISADMKNFRKITTGNTLVLGRKTLESFPNGLPLPDRDHIVLSTNPMYACKEAIICHNLAEMKHSLAMVSDKDIFVVGGGSIYEQLLPFCDTAYITKIHDIFPADTYFPDLDKSEDWIMEVCGDVQEEKGLSFSFCIYKNKNAQSL